MTRRLLPTLTISAALAGSGLLAADDSTAPDSALFAQAENGDADVQWRLAQSCISDGNTSEADAQMGVEWLRRAAEGGCLPAQLALAEDFLTGAHLTQDSKRALLWLRRAADGGYAVAQVKLGRIYLDGDGVDRDPIEALRHLKAAVDAGYQEIEARYGMIAYEHGATPEEKQAALALIQRAEERGEIEARRFLLVEAKKDLPVFATADQRLRVLRQGVDDDDLPSHLHLGNLLYRGDATPRDVDAALPLLEKAARGGFSEAAHILVEHYGNELDDAAEDSAPEEDFATAVASEKYVEAIVLVGIYGNQDDRVSTARALTQFIGPDDPEMLEILEKHLPDALVVSLALIRVYRKGGGKDASALRWLKAMEDHFQKSELTYSEDELSALEILDAAELQAESALAYRHPESCL